MSEVRVVDAKQAHAWLAAGEALLVDVRSPDEFKSEHIAYAVSFPLAGIGEFAKYFAAGKERKLIFQCLRGKRGGEACAVVSKLGQGAVVYNLEGGIEAWKAAGLPVLAAVRGVPIFRQVQMGVGLMVLVATLAGFLVSPWGFAVAGMFGAALMVAGATGWCGLGMLLARMPWNR